MTLKRTVPGLGLLVIVLAGCESRPARPRLGEVDRVPRVETVKARYAARDMSVELLATVEPMEKTRLAAQVAGEVKEMSQDVDIGRVIKKDEPLLVLDVPAVRAELASKEALLLQAGTVRDQARQALVVAAREVDEARAQLARYEADLTFRDTQLRRNRELGRRNAIQPQLVEESELQRNTSKATLDAAKVTVLTKKAKLEAAEVDLKVAESRIKVAEADVKQLQTRINFATIRAPFDGIITRRWVNNGDVIKDPGTPLLTVMRTDTYRVVLDIPERYVPLVRAEQGKSLPGEANRVRLNVQGYQLEARLTRLATAVEMTTRLMRAEIHVANTGTVHLRSGMTGTAVLVLDEAQDRKLTVPSTALVRDGDQVFVYLVDGVTGDQPPRGQVKQVAVEVGLDDGKTAEIVKGLAGNELVVAKGNGMVRPGEAVVPVEARELKFEQ